MTPAAKITYATAAFIGLLFGFGSGFRKGKFALDIQRDVGEYGAIAELRDFSYLQYKYADHDHAKESLLMYAAFLEQVDGLSPANHHQRDLAVTYTRLALLEDSARNFEQSHTYIEKARSLYKTSTGRDYSESEMKATLKTFDEQVRP